MTEFLVFPQPVQPVGFAQTSQAEACSTENIYTRPFHIPVIEKRDSRSSGCEKLGLGFAHEFYFAGAAFDAPRVDASNQDPYQVLEKAF
jgi:hypothetical protein